MGRIWTGLRVIGQPIQHAWGSGALGQRHAGQCAGYIHIFTGQVTRCMIIIREDTGLLQVWSPSTSFLISFLAT